MSMQSRAEGVTAPEMPEILNVFRNVNVCFRNVIYSNPDYHGTRVFPLLQQCHYCCLPERHSFWPQIKQLKWLHFSLHMLHLILYVHVCETMALTLIQICKKKKFWECNLAHP